jgi:hypothetical protein
MEKRYDIISPDGFPIHPEKTFTQKEILPAFEEWKQNFIEQGYYSSVGFGRIDLYDLQDYCEVIEVKERTDDSVEA